MARSTQPTKTDDRKGVGSAPAAKRAAPPAGRKPARSEAGANAGAAPDRRRPPEPASESAAPVLPPPVAVSAALDHPAQASSAESAVAEPMPPGEVRAAIAESHPAASSVDQPQAPTVAAAAVPEPLAAAAEQALANVAISWPSSSLVESSIRIGNETIAFTWRQTEHGWALGRAIAASRSLPEILALQMAYLGGTAERTLAHTLELARLSTDMLRTGLQSPRAD